MALSADIYSRFAVPQKSVADFDREYEDAQAARQGRQMNALKLLMAQRQEQDAQRTIGEQEGIRNALAQLGQGATDEGRVNALRALGTQTAFGQADALEKSLLERKKTQALIDKDATDTRAKSLKMIREGLGFVYSNPTPEAAMQQIALLEKQLQTDLTPYKQQVAGFTTPEQLKQWAAGHALEIDKALPSFVTRDTGGAQQTIRQSPVTGQVEVINSVAKTQSPDNAASNARMAAEGAADRAVQIRGQNLTDARERATPRGQFIQTTDGYVLADPRTGAVSPVTGPDGKPLQGKAADRALTEGQAKANLFGTRMQEADKIIGDLAARGFAAPSFAQQITGGEGITGAISTAMASPEQQQIDQAQRDFINAVLRRESGAAIASSEFQNARKQYFVQPGDSKAVIAQKARNRQLAIKGMLAEVPEGKRVKTGETEQPSSGFKYLGTE